MTLTPYVYSIAPEYFQDFWTKPGYEGTNPDSTEVRDRLKFVTTVEELIPRVREKSEDKFTSVDNSWVNTMIGNQETPHVRLSEQPPADAYLDVYKRQDS